MTKNRKASQIMFWFLRPYTHRSATPRLLSPTGWTIVFNQLPPPLLVNHMPGVDMRLQHDPTYGPERRTLSQIARFRLCVHTLRFETAAWNQRKSHTCDMCDTDDIQDEQHVLFQCVNPRMNFLRKKCFPPTGAHDVSTFLSQNNNKLYL